MALNILGAGRLGEKRKEGLSPRERRVWEMIGMREGEADVAGHGSEPP
jgi:hypothetical protein